VRQVGERLSWPRPTTRPGARECCYERRGHVPILFMGRGPVILSGLFSQCEQHFIIIIIFCLIEQGLVKEVVSRPRPWTGPGVQGALCASMGCGPIYS
jgi:hypothetical protein